MHLDVVEFDQIGQGEVFQAALAGRLAVETAADAVANARVAALADPDGESLAKTLALIAASSATQRLAAE